MRGERGAEPATHRRRYKPIFNGAHNVRGAKPVCGLLVQGLTPGRHIVEMGYLDRAVEKDDKTQGVQLIGLGSVGVTQG
jgi:hypothetical protein